jgi:hypothetical protein
MIRKDRQAKFVSLVGFVVQNINILVAAEGRARFLVASCEMNSCDRRDLCRAGGIVWKRLSVVASQQCRSSQIQEEGKQEKAEGKEA